MDALTTQIANAKSLLAFLESQLPKEEVVEKPKKETKKKVEEKPVEEKKKETKKKTEEKKVEEKKQAHIPRMSASNKKLLATALKSIANVEIDDKIVDKFKKYINDDMTTAKFESEQLEDHVSNFVRLNFVKGGFVSPHVGEDEPPEIDWSNASSKPAAHKLQKSVSKEQFNAMKDSKILKPLGDNNYWSPSDGMWILVEHDDDEFEDVEFEGEMYCVCKKNKRVYQTDKTIDKDMFVGFVGFNKFKSMVV